MSVSVDLKIISSADVNRLLTYEDCIRVVEAAMQETSRRTVNLPLRQVMTVKENSLYGWMPGSMQNPGYFGTKLISMFHGNTAHGLSSHLGMYVLHEANFGKPIAIIEAGALTAIRTACASAVATKHLARKDARRLAIVGAGEEAETHLVSMQRVRAIEDVTIWARNADKGEAFVKKFQKADGPKLRFVADIAEAVADADIICTVTGAGDPILFGDMIKPGQHINLVGASTAARREVDSELVRRSRFYVDYLESAMAQAGELLTAIQEGVVTRDHVIGEIGEVINGSKPGRRSDDDITVYKSLGISSQDIAAAAFLYENAGPGIQTAKL